MMIPMVIAPPSTSETRRVSSSATTRRGSPTYPLAPRTGALIRCLLLRRCPMRRPSVELLLGGVTNKRCYEMPFGKVAWAYTFRDGLIVHQKLYMSQSEALEAVGLSEQGAH